MKEFKTMRITEPGWATDFQYHGDRTYVQSWNLDTNELVAGGDQSIETTEKVLSAAHKDPDCRVEELTLPDIRPEL